MQDIDKDFDTFLNEKIHEVVKGNQQNNPNTPASEPLEFNIAGQQLKFASKQELETALSTFVSQQASQNQQMQAQLAELQGQQNNQQYVTGEEAPSWSDESFIEKMTKAPKEAMEYAFNQLLFDGKSQDPVTDIKSRFEEMELTKRSIAAYQFKEQHPEFPGGQQFANTIDQIRQQMNLPYDINGLEAAYLMGINKGVIPNFYGQQQQQQQSPQQEQQQGYNQPPQGYEQFQRQGQNPYLQAPPGVGRNSPSTWEPQFDPESLSTEQIEQIMAKAGKPVQRRQW